MIILPSIFLPPLSLGRGREGAQDVASCRGAGERRTRRRSEGASSLAVCFPVAFLAPLLAGLGVRQKKLNALRTSKEVGGARLRRLSTGGARWPSGSVGKTWAHWRWAFSVSLREVRSILGRDASLRPRDFEGRSRDATSFDREMKTLANKVGAANAGWRQQFRFRGSRHRPGVADLVMPLETSPLSPCT